MHRRWLELAALVYTLYVVLGTLVPYDFSGDAIRDSASGVFDMTLVDNGLPDVFGNLVLYFPVGVLYTALARRRRLPAPIAVVGAAFIGLGLALSLEFLQLFSTARDSSFTDVVCDLGGTIAGACAYLFIASRPDKWLLTFHSKGGAGNPAATAAIIWAAAVGFVTLAPFDFALAPSHLVDAVRNAHLVPFEAYAMLLQKVRTFGGNADAYDAALVQLWQLRIDYIVEILFAAVLADLIAAAVARSEQRKGSVASTAAAYTMFWAAVITTAGFFVRSVGFDVTHIVTAAAGSFVGMLVHFSRRRLFQPTSLPAEDAPARPDPRLIAGVYICAGIIILRELAPFRFIASRGLRGFAEIEWMPHALYWTAKITNSVDDLVQKSFMFLLVGGLVAWKRIDAHRPPRRWNVVLAVTGGVVILEAFQCFLPGRYPSITDVVTAFLATLAGITMGQSLHKTYQDELREARSHKQGRAFSATALNVELPRPGSDQAGRSPADKRRHAGAPTTSQ